MPTRNVVLSAPQEGLIHDLVAKGRYQNASEVIRAGLRLLEDHEATIAEIRGGVIEGLKQAAAGETMEGTEAINRAFQQALAKSHE